MATLAGSSEHCSGPPLPREMQFRPYLQLAGRACLPHGFEASLARYREGQSMRNKLWAGIAALAIGIGVASCGENEEPASKQSSSKAPETQQTAKQSAPAEPEGQTAGP